MGLIRAGRAAGGAGGVPRLRRLPGLGQLVDPPAPSTDCRTPALAYNWVYEAVNYDAASDAALADLPTRGAARGPALPPDDGSTSDEIGLAGWYIPAGNGSGPTGPTVVLVHGQGGNKSGMLEHAAVLHDEYNLVLFDFRNHGQSGGPQTTVGAREQTTCAR